jgi:hypothetical protein
VHTAGRPVTPVAKGRPKTLPARVDHTAELVDQQARIGETLGRAVEGSAQVFVYEGS